MQITNWKSKIACDIPALLLVRWLSGRKQRFAKSKTAFRLESSHLILSLQFQTREAITPNRFFSRVLLRPLISTRRLTFLTYLFRASDEANLIWTSATAMPPSPTAAAQRFTEPERTSPAAKIPGRLVSSRPGVRLAPFHAGASATARPVLMKPFSSHSISGGSQFVQGLAPIIENT